MARYRERALQRTSVVSVRFHPTELALLRSAAAQVGRQLSDHVRERCLSSLPPPTPQLAYPVVPHHLLTSLRALHANASTVHLRAASWKGRIESSRYRRHAKEEIYELVDDLSVLLEHHVALAGQLLLDAGVHIRTS